jgi:O-antigen/teichoic acid export membrane protein
VFSALASIFSIGTLFIAALGQSMFMPLTRAYDARDWRAFRFNVLTILLLGMALGGAGVLGAKLAGEQFLRIVFTPEYARYHDLFVWVMVVAAVGYMSAPLGYALTAARVYRPQVYSLAIVALAAIAASEVLIHRFGLYGAVFAVLVAWFVQILLSLIILIASIRRRIARDRAELPSQARSAAPNRPLILPDPGIQP